MELTSSVQYLKGIGEAKAKALARLGVRDAEGLLNFFPRAYEDRSRFSTIARLTEGESVSVRP